VEWDAAPGITYELELVSGGRLRSYSATVGDDVEDGTVTASAVRGAPVMAMAQEARRYLRSVAADVRKPIKGRVGLGGGKSRPMTARENAESAARWAEHADRLDQIAARPGRAGRGLAFYLDLAVEYSALVDVGEPNPIAVMAALTRASTPAETLRGQVNHARRVLGLLTAAPKGRAGGTLTAKARRLLDGQH
jgi:hypothetical protein